MPTTCVHGFAPGECLICRTLGTTSQTVATSEAAPSPTYRPENHAGSSQSPARPDAVYGPDAARRRHGHRLGGSLIVAVAALVAVGAAAWILVGIVFSALHLLELIAIAAGAGWVGYKIGHFRGSRSRPGRS